MSWMKRRTPNSTPNPPQQPQPPIQMYNPNQHGNMQNQWQQQDLHPANNWYNQTQQSEQKPNTQPTQQADYWNQANYNQNASNQFNHQSPNVNPAHANYYDSSYQQQQHYPVSDTPNYGQANSVSQQGESDTWGNWGWGDEDNSNMIKNANANSQVSNNLADSFAADESWNWSVEEPKATNANQAPEKNRDQFPKMGKLSEKLNRSPNEVQEELPLDNVGAVQLKQKQWSTESHLSQDSSDLLHTSESDKSHILSRSSTVSESPTSGHDPHPEPDSEYFRQEATNYGLENREVLSKPPIKPPVGDESKNPYKRGVPVSHKAANKLMSGGQNFFASSLAPATAFTQSVNLETLPDNAEQPDSIPQHSHQPKTPIHWPENNEIAPINDRNQYLETGHLSNSEIDTQDLLPAPGLQRMVLGQIEQSDSNQSQHAEDQPPPGFSRMVLGQTSHSSNPPAGLHRMIPGESSSPENPTNTRKPHFYNPEPELTRSVTIGADTPPVLTSSTNSNRSETIGADRPPSSDNRVNADGANNLDQDDLPSATGLNSLTDNLRDLNIKDNANDLVQEAIARRNSKQDSSDSENEHRSKSGKDRKERRYHDDRDKERERRKYSPSPESYRDRKHDRKKYRDRRYEEDTDYYSDRDRNNRRDVKDKRDDYDRKYSSLKRDKDKDNRRSHRSHKDYSRDGRRNDYVRYEEDYEDEPRSRASSRTDSMHESYRHDRDRHRDRERQRERHRRHRDNFMPYMQGYQYDPYNPYYQQYQYYENLRRTNPQAYAEWYRKYCQQTGAQPSYGGEDRASVHSGRSSANDELVKERFLRQSYYSQASLPHMGSYYRDSHTHSISGHYGLDDSISTRRFDQTDSSLYLDENSVAIERSTPAKFATAHVKASIASGNLIKILPHYPLDGQSATVEICSLYHLLNNEDDCKELMEFPGPLVKGVSHKKTIIEYCENKIRNATFNRDILDPESYILMWELLILLLRQNGMVVGTDIAELLMKNRKASIGSRRPSVASNSSSIAAEITNEPLSETNSTLASNLKDEAVTNKFREYLIYGSGKEALEWAMKNGLWGHALFLASKLDKRTYANVMTRFANGLAMNDPLQTLYQLLSGKIPASVTCIVDEKWGDWRPHLAMILSNTSQRPELDRKSITTLGDTLMARGSLYAAQFCYLMAQVGFGCYGKEDVKLVLLGSDQNKPFREFASNEAIHMTEIYEYACCLNDANFTIPELQTYKYLISTRLAERGLLEKALAYLEKVSLEILQNPSTAQSTLVNQICELADRLKYNDPVEDPDMIEGDLDVSRPDNSWLKDLKAIQKDFGAGLIMHQSVDSLAHATSSELEVLSSNQQTVQDAWQQPQQHAEQYQQQWQQPQYVDYQHQNEQQSAEGFNKESDHHHQQQQQQQQQYWPNQQWNDGSLNSATDQFSQPWNHSQSEREESIKSATEEAPQQPQISMPNQSRGPNIFDEPAKPQNAMQSMKREGVVTHKPPIGTKHKEASASSPGWFGGIWNKLSLRPKNQMKLPDDKNPTIVWDETNKRWVNLDEEGDGATTELKPPPKMTDIFPEKRPTPPQADVSYQPHSQINPTFSQNVTRNVAAVNPITVQNTLEETATIPKASQPNMFKLQRGRNLKKSYVDIFNPGGGKVTASIPAPQSLNAPSNAPPTNFFVPPTISDPNAPMDFLTSAGMQPVPNSQVLQQE